MFTKTLFALVTALVLSTSFVSLASAQTGGGNCVSHSTEEGYRSALPAYRVC
jgi:hypothetical protein